MRAIKVVFTVFLIISPGLTWGSIAAGNCNNKFVEKDLVYILPYNVCSDYWAKTYGDRIYYYVYGNLSKDQEYIDEDFRRITCFYDKVIIVIPADDTSQFFSNIHIIDRLAGENNLKVIYAVFPNDKYGKEDTYLDDKSKMHDLVIQDMEFLGSLSNTSKVAVWYGWSYRCNTRDITNFYFSLPENLRDVYAIWLDEEYARRVTDVYGEGLPENVLVITEAYSKNLIKQVSGIYLNQLLVTGYEGAVSIEDWHTHIEELLSFCKTNKIGIWIYCDKNDGSGEEYTACINGKLIDFCKNFQKGFSYAAWWNDTLLQSSSDLSLNNLRETGTEWVSLVPTWYQDDLHSTEIKMDKDRTPSDESIIHAIEIIHSLGMKVMLKPHVDPLNDEWRGGIEFSDENKWDAWFNSYKNFISHYLEIANNYGVEQFCIGCELVRTTDRAEWYNVIDMIQENYSGSITYAADWSNYESIPFWDELDFIGIDAYFPLTNKTDPTIEEILESWRNWKQDIEEIHNITGKPVIFTEIGYRSINGCNMDPWNWQREGIIDLQEQADCYDAVFKTFYNENWFSGIYWWMWYPDLTGGAKDKRYTPYGKPAEEILKNYYKDDEIFVGIYKPAPGKIYFMNHEMMSVALDIPIIIGGIDIKVISNGDITEFYVDDELEYVDYEEPYEWFWDEFGIGLYKIKVIAYDDQGHTVEDELLVLNFP